MRELQPNVWHSLPALLSELFQAEIREHERLRKYRWLMEMVWDDGKEDDAN